MKNEYSTVGWVQKPHHLLRLTGGFWQERCYPFRSVFGSERTNEAIERGNLLDDFRLAIQELEVSNERN